MKTFKQRNDLMKDFSLNEDEISDLKGMGGKSGFGGTATNAASGGTAGSMCQGSSSGAGGGTMES